MQRISRDNYQDDEIVKKMPETYEKYGRYVLRDFSIFNNWRKGETYESIGKFYNLHKETIRQIVLKQCCRYNYIKNPPPPKAKTAIEINFNKICSLTDNISCNKGHKVRVINRLLWLFSKELKSYDWNPYEAISKMNDRDYLNIRCTGLRTLLVFHEARDEARRRLEEDDSRVDTSDGEAT